MSLIAHWPLTGNSNDISGNGYNLTASGTITTIPIGKIGQTYDFSAGRLSFNYGGKMDLTQNITISFWIKLDSLPADRFGIFETYYGAEFALNVNSSGTLTWYYGTSGSQASPYTDQSPGVGLTVGQWMHITLVRDLQENKTKIYRNGILLAAQNLAYIPAQSVDTTLKIGYNYTGYLDGCLNDFRIYNNVLNDIEIQELARAKILHYTFDDMQEPTTNLTPAPAQNYWVNSGAWTRNPNEVDVQKPFLNDNLTIWSGLVTTVGSIQFGYSATPASPSTVYTISVWFRQNRAGCSAPYIRSNANDNSLINFSYNGSTNSATWPVNKWIRIAATVTTPANENGIYLANYIGTTVGDKIWYYGYQVEQKNYATEYVYGSRSGIVRDYSGFFNDSIALTEGSTPRWLPDAKIGTGAYSFNYTNQDYISLPAFKTDPQKITLCAWAKSNGITKAQNIISRNGPFFLRLYGSKLRVGIYTGTWVFVNGVTTLQTDTWYHLALTYDGSYVRGYINGVLDIESAQTGDMSGWSNTVRIGYTTGGEDAPMDGLIDDFRIYATALSEKDILDLYETRAEIEEKGTLYSRDFLSDAQETVNLILDKKNSIPLVGNAHRTYETGNAYWGGSAYSLGNLISITNNIATFDETGRALYTYDAVYPETTGGGLTASTHYFIKKHGPRQYSFHTYNSSQDGSQAYINETTGGFQVHYSVDSDTRRVINATNFPTSWKGMAHLPNQALVKQIIPNGFIHEGRVHDCMRLITSFRYPDPISGYMAYGVLPKVTAGNLYTFSFYARAANAVAVGKSIKMTLYTTTNWPNGGNYAYNMTLTTDWQRYEMTGQAPNNGNTYMYFPYTGYSSGPDIDIAEIQCEEGTRATPFTASYRPISQLPATLDFKGNEIHETGTANFTDFSTVGIIDGLVGYWPLDKNAKDYSGNNYNGTVSGAILKSNYYTFDAVDDYITIPNGIDYSKGFSLSIYVNPVDAGENGYGRIVDKCIDYSATDGFFFYMTNTLCATFGIAAGDSMTTTANSIPYNTWTHLIITVDSFGATKIYVNGILNISKTLYAPSQITTTNLLTIGNRSGATDRTFNGGISNLKIFNRVLTAEEIKIEYNLINNEVQIHESGILYAKDLIQY